MADTETKYLNVALTPAENDEVRELAVKERRRPSLMGAVLIAEALAARRTPPRPHRRKPTPGHVPGDGPVTQYDVQYPPAPRSVGGFEVGE